MGIYEIDAKVKELRELRNMEAEVKSAITVIEDSLKAEMLAKNTDVLSGKDYTMPGRFCTVFMRAVKDCRIEKGPAVSGRAPVRLAGVKAPEALIN